MNSESQLLIRMAKELGVLPAQLEKIIRTAPLRYKKFEIPKRNGEMRLVAQPAREVKAIQRWLMDALTPILPMHGAATAYREGSSIRANASAHVRNKYLLKMDFENFFPSITAKDVVIHLETHCKDKLSEGDRMIIGRACTWAPDRMPPLRLCIGAPSSPLLSNSVMYDFDCKIASLALERGVEYSRYADDISLSCIRKGLLGEMEVIVKEVVGCLKYPSLKINEKKTVHASKAARRTVTGINLTPEGKLSVGRDRKRLVRAMYHRFTKAELSEEERESLIGMLSFIDSVEPGFSDRLKKQKDN